MSNETYMLIALVLLVMVLVIACIFIYFKEGYKQGQIDALSGKQHYHLVEFKDGVRKYYH